MFIPADRLKNVRVSATRLLYDSAPAGSINLGLGEPDFQTPDVVRREAVRAIEQERNGYTSNAGLKELRERVAAYHSDGATSRYSPDSVCVTNGSEEALFSVIMATAGPGDDVLVPDPGYVAYPTIAEMAGARVIRYNLPAAADFALDRSSFERAVTPATRLVLLVSPSNPTGRVLAADDLEFIAGRLGGSGAYVVADEIYRELYFGERPRSISEFLENAVIVSGLSKMMSMTGWRLGWAVGPADLMKHVTLTHQYVSTCAPTISQKAGIAAFSPEGVAETARMRDELARRRVVMARAIEREIGLPYFAGEGAFYIMLDVSRFGASEQVARGLLDERVITVPGSAFGQEAEGYLRLSYPIEPELIEQGIQRVAIGLGRKRPG